MTRKLHRHLNALAVSTALALALPLVAMIAPSPSEYAKTVATHAQAPTTEATVAQETKALPQRRRANSRDALSLPFFSFARTLRRGNGS